VKLGDTPWKFSVEINYYVERPDAFGPEVDDRFQLCPSGQQLPPIVVWRLTRNSLEGGEAGVGRERQAALTRTHDETKQPIRHRSLCGDRTGMVMHGGRHTCVRRMRHPGQDHRGRHWDLNETIGRRVPQPKDYSQC